MKTVLYYVLLIAIVSCQRADTVAPDYPDWYTVRAPVDHIIQAVWGSYEKTLLISTVSRLFRSTDQGKNWQQIRLQSNGVLGFFQNQDTLFTMTGLANSKILTNPSHYSVDDGKTWQPYKERNPIFNYDPVLGKADKRLYINPAISSTGVSYAINQVYLTGPATTSSTYETPGIVTSTGRRIDLPQLHQLQSLYIDDQQRLYIAASDAICRDSHSGSFFCTSEYGQGFVYISKKPLL